MSDKMRHAFFRWHKNGKNVEIRIVVNSYTYSYLVDQEKFSFCYRQDFVHNVLEYKELEDWEEIERDELPETIEDFVEAIDTTLTRIKQQVESIEL